MMEREEIEMLEKGLRTWLIPTDHASSTSAGGKCMHLAGGPCWVASSCGTFQRLRLEMMIWVTITESLRSEKASKII